MAIEHYYSLVSDVTEHADSRWQARTTGYVYSLDDADGRESLAYHWHPFGRSPVTRPHLHFGAPAGSLRPQLQRAHVQTDPITPVALIDLLIESFGARPRRTDWAHVLRHARSKLDRS